MRRFDPFARDPLMPHAAGHPYRPHVVHYGTKRRPRITFSATELKHLAGAVVALTAAFSIFMSRPGTTFAPTGASVGRLVLAAAIAVVTGFVLHELGHKVVAQRYGLWAEFRASPMGLLAAIAIAFLGFLFAAPGAVYISGYVKTEENGRISLVGPLINLVIALAVFPFVAQPGGGGSALGQMLYVVFLVNGFLALFNLLPFGPLDGKKVLAWHKGLWALSFALALGTVLWPFLGDRLL